MIKKISLLFGMFIGAMNINAQSVEAKSEKTEMKHAKSMTLNERVIQQVEKRTKQLGLTPEQQVEWKIATEKHLTTRAELKGKRDGPVNKEERKKLTAEMKVNERSYDETLLTILDPSQEQKWMDVKSKEHERSPKRRTEKLEQKK
jgi:hypothetical protein